MNEHALCLMVRIPEHSYETPADGQNVTPSRYGLRKKLATYNRAVLCEGMVGAVREFASLEPGKRKL